MKLSAILIMLVLVPLLFAGCGVSDSNGKTDDQDEQNGENGQDEDDEDEDDDDNDDTHVEYYSIAVEVSPPEAGSVDPSSGQFEEGSQVSIEAFPNPGWGFVEWTGSHQSLDNPLLFNIEADVNLTANFRDIRSVYTIELRMADSRGESEALQFGQREHPFSEPAPPRPPEGALHAWFYHNGEELFKDLRSELETGTAWELHYQAADGENLTLTWEIHAEKMEGSLILTDPENKFEIDMMKLSSFRFLNGEHTYFLMVYQNQH